MDETSDHASNTLPNPANLTIGDWIKWFTPAQLWAVLAAGCVLVSGAFALGIYFAPLLGDSSKQTKESASPKWTGPAEAPSEVWSGPPEVPLSDITKPGALEIAELDRKNRDVRLRSDVKKILEGANRTASRSVNGHTYKTGDRFPVKTWQYVRVLNLEPLEHNGMEISFGETCGIGPIESENLKNPLVELLGFLDGYNGPTGLLRYHVDGSPSGSPCPSGVIFAKIL